jgi:hypothetical protein
MLRVGRVVMPRNADLRQESAERCASRAQEQRPPCAFPSARW